MVDCADLDYAERIAARCAEALYVPANPVPAPTETPTPSATPAVSATPTTSGAAGADNDRLDAAPIPVDQDGGSSVAEDASRDPSALPVLAAVAAMATVGGAGWLAARRQRTLGR